MKKPEKIVLPNSLEAAQLKQVIGWVARNGTFWGKDERMARYVGSTHKYCECGNLIEKCSYCNKCASARTKENFERMERVAWDGETPLVTYDGVTYFFSNDELQDYCCDNRVQPRDLMLVLAKPCYAREINFSEYYCDDLPEGLGVDDILPGYVLDAFDAVNKVIRECNTPLSSWPSDKAVDPESLPVIEFDDETHPAPQEIIKP
jgi:hypothetical protein